ncbi:MULTISPECIES: glycosyltransferase family 2 protein [Dactylosporangium]|uniref:Glycosyl transferase n=2 Tax=Dactylosporangium TaxID=35753 RepID=A0A9W6NQX7_9ACTN|nr:MULTISPECIES: glycosyltransferase family 2 protein [Dactylosporangium]UAB96429.1 glycosyltransferase family 2 protein [Dactylosporangium vinaceum]UWZ44748.1 glycosyltransferase family 2 protein [Dactylosporangium matsuzakiense]GLL05999.1 glycosyl transferase [Dactylosporangium matsuzakiense]
MSVSVVVPCYRSAGILPRLVERLNAVLPEIDPVHEIILVVDSTDSTWDAARALAIDNPHVQAIRMARNYGQHNALIAGIRAASCERIITMDDDLQHPPEELPKLAAALTDDLDVVYAVSETEEHSPLRNFTSWGAKSLVMGRTMGIPNADVLGALRIFRTFLRAGFDQVSGPHVSVDIVLSWTTTRVGSVVVRMDQRCEGRSGFTFKSLMKHAINMILGYSTKPLRLVTYLGFLIGVCGVLLTLRLVWLYFTGDTKVAGFTTLASLVTIFSSAQMIGIGVLGEYLGRVHAHGMGRPTYVVREHFLKSEG